MALDTDTINRARQSARLSYPGVEGAPFRDDINQGVNLANLQYGWTLDPRDTIRLYQIPPQLQGRLAMPSGRNYLVFWCITIQAEPRSTRPDPALAKRLKVLRWMRVTNHSWVYCTPVPAPWT